MSKTRVLVILGNFQPVFLMANWKNFLTWQSFKGTEVKGSLSLLDEKIMYVYI